MYPLPVDEYRLMMVLNELPLMSKRSRALDLLDLVNKKAVQLLAWSDNIILKRPDEEV